MRPKETKYKGYRFRSRLEARWAVFFDALGLKWLYEPEPFDLHFDYEDFIEDFDMDEEELLELHPGVPQTLKVLDGRRYSYLPDFYLPELNYWIEVKGTNPNNAEMLKSFFLSHSVHKAAPPGEPSPGRAYIFYGNIPWPFPERGNAVGFMGTGGPGGISFGPERLWASLGLCWQQCRLCTKMGISPLGAFYCRDCKGELEKAIYSRIASAGETSWGFDTAYETTIARALLYGIQAPPEEEMESKLEKLAKEELELVGWALDRKMRIEKIEKERGKHDRLVQKVLNLEFFTTGHKTPDLRNAYDAARSARFEHGEYGAGPRPPG